MHGVTAVFTLSPGPVPRFQDVFGSLAEPGCSEGRLPRSARLYHDIWKCCAKVELQHALPGQLELAQGLAAGRAQLPGKMGARLLVLLPDGPACTRADVSCAYQGHEHAAHEHTLVHIVTRCRCSTQLHCLPHSCVLPTPYGGAAHRCRAFLLHLYIICTP